MEFYWYLYEACASSYANKYRNEIIRFKTRDGIKVFKYDALDRGSDVLFVVRNLIENVVYYVFLGSNDRDDWKNNAKYKKTPMDSHTGFTDTAIAFCDIIKNDIEKYKYKSIGFNGYSRGAAIAEISAYLLCDQNNDMKFLVDLATFAKPNTGGVRYNTKLNELVDPEKNLMTIISGDPVVGLPTYKMGYNHNLSCEKVILPKPWWSYIRLPGIGIAIHKSYGKMVRKLLDCYE